MPVLLIWGIGLRSPYSICNRNQEVRIWYVTQLREGSILFMSFFMYKCQFCQFSWLNRVVCDITMYLFVCSYFIMVLEECNISDMICIPLLSVCWHIDYYTRVWSKKPTLSPNFCPWSIGVRLGRRFSLLASVLGIPFLNLKKIVKKSPVWKPSDHPGHWQWNPRQAQHISAFFFFFFYDRLDSALIFFI